MNRLNRKMQQKKVVSLLLCGYADKPTVTFNISRKVSEIILSHYFHMTLQLLVQLWGEAEVLKHRKIGYPLCVTFPTGKRK